MQNEMTTSKEMMTILLEITISLVSVICGIDVILDIEAFSYFWLNTCSIAIIFVSINLQGFSFYFNWGWPPVDSVIE